MIQAKVRITRREEILGFQRKCPRFSTHRYTGGALFIIWDEAEDSGSFSDGPVGYDRALTAYQGRWLRELGSLHSRFHAAYFSEIFGVSPLLGDAANEMDLSDLFGVSP